MQKLQPNISKQESKKPAQYILIIYLISMILSVMFEYCIYSKTENIILSIVITILAFIPITEIVIQIIQYILSKFIKPKLIPKLDLINGIPEEYTTVVVIPTIIKNVEKIKELFSKLEVFYLANKSENLYFALLGDASSSNNEKEKFDEEVINSGLNMTKYLKYR